MPRTGPTSPNDYNHPVKNAGSFNIAEKQAIVKANRLVTGKVLNTTNTNATQTVVPVTDLTFRVLKGKRYRVVGRLLTAGTGAAGGFKGGLFFAGSAGCEIVYKYFTAAGSTAERVISLTSTPSGVAAAALEIDIDGLITPNESGSVYLQFANTTGVQAATLQPGSWIAVTRI